jgi:hypothetical protein
MHNPGSLKQLAHSFLSPINDDSNPCSPEQHSIPLRHLNPDV